LRGPRDWCNGRVIDGQHAVVLLLFFWRWQHVVVVDYRTRIGQHTVVVLVLVSEQRVVVIGREQQVVVLVLVSE
jgi:hypothetical protein